MSVDVVSFGEQLIQLVGREYSWDVMLIGAYQEMALEHLSKRILLLAETIQVNKQAAGLALQLLDFL